MDDPTLYVLNKMQAVFEELNVNVERFNLHELKNSITTLPQTLKEADGIILATTVEWYGIGGYMQQLVVWRQGKNLHHLYESRGNVHNLWGKRCKVKS